MKTQKKARADDPLLAVFMYAARQTVQQVSSTRLELDDDKNSMKM